MYFDLLKPTDDLVTSYCHKATTPADINVLHHVSILKKGPLLGKGSQKQYGHF